MKRIPLSRNKFALVDDEDFEYLSQFKWYCSSQNYACRNIWDYKNKRDIHTNMHRFILKPAKDQLVDHINGDTLDNRKINLRLCNSRQNARNRRVAIDNTSGYKGVFYRKDRDKYYSMIQVDGKQRYLGYFSSKEKAAKAYNEAARKHYREFAKLNNI